MHGQLSSDCDHFLRPVKFQAAARRTRYLDQQVRWIGRQRVAASADWAMSIVRFTTSKLPVGKLRALDERLRSPYPSESDPVRAPNRLNTALAVGRSSSARRRRVEQRRSAAHHAVQPLGWRSRLRVALVAGLAAVRLTAMVRSALTAAIGAIGSGSRMPPSASSRRRSCGAITPGMAMEARMASSTAALKPHRLAGQQIGGHRGVGDGQLLDGDRAEHVAHRVQDLSARSTPAAVIDGSSSRRMVRCVKDFAQSANSSRCPAACTPPTNAPIDEPAIPTIS